MPPRLSKRQQRAQEEELTLGKTQDLVTPGDASDATDGGEPGPSPKLSKPAAAGFAALAVAGGDEEEVSAEEDAPVRASKPKKKKKKKASSAATPGGVATPVAVNTPPPAAAESTSAEPSKAAKKAAKKARAKEKQKDEGDDLDKALAELSVKYPDLQTTSTSSPSTSSNAPTLALTSLLAVQSQHLDPATELRKFFGSKVVSSSSTPTPGSGRRGAAPSSAAARGQLVKHKPTWWPPQTREGLSLRALDAKEVYDKAARHGWSAGQIGGERWWTVEYSRKYKGATLGFMRTVASGDPEGFWRQIRTLPWHADTLLQLAEGYRYREEHSTATDFVERALFAYERAFAGTSFAFSAGTARLDFDRAENRPFFLALHRIIVDLHRRGCVRTALEFARALYALDPHTDPQGALLHLDFLALRASVPGFVLEMWDAHAALAKAGLGEGRMDVRGLPGWWFARALAMRMREEADKKDHEESTAALMEAIITFPTVVPVLADKADITLAGNARAHTAFRISTHASSLSNPAEATQHLLSHLYATRSSPLWKPAPVASWFSNTVASALPSLPPSPLTSSPSFHALFGASAHPELTASAHRHVLALELRPLLGFIPRGAGAGRTGFGGDPLPPLTRVSAYDDAFFAGAGGAEEEEGGVRLRRPRNRAEEVRMLERMVPDRASREQLEGFFAAHPAFARRFPAGIVQFVAAAAQMDEGELAEMMLAVAAAEEGGGADAAAAAMGGAMPGGMGDFEEFEEFEGEEGEEDEDDGAPGILGNLVNRLFGRAQAPGEESSDEGDEAGGHPPGALH